MPMKNPPHPGKVVRVSCHGITTQIPHEVSVAVPRDSRVPSLDYPPIRAHRFSQEAYRSGIETHLRNTSN